MPGRDLSAELYGSDTSKSGGKDLSAELYQTAAPTKPLSWSDVPLSAAKNLLPSAGSFLSGIGQAVAHPINTVGNLMDVGAGTLQNITPAPIRDFINQLDTNPQAAEQARKAANAAGGFFKERYGSEEGLKKTLATDPVGVASDLSALFTGGAGLAKLGGSAARTAAVRGAIPGAATTSAALTGAGDVLQRAGSAVNPISLPMRAAPVLGNAAAAAIGGLGTHTGAETIKQAFRSGQQGGASEQAFTGNLRGNVPMTDVLDTAKANLEQMGRDKSAAYRQGMAQVSGDKTVLDFTGIDQAVSDAAKVATFKGKVKNTKAAQVQQAIADAVEEWKTFDPAEYHTPEGLDALKQKIGGIVESIPYEEKTAGLVGKKIYNSVKDEITKQAPVYADTMKGYTEASDQIREIERALSLGSKASVDTAMRKLQSLTRNNVNTNYGNRLDLARQLEQQGGQALMPALAGQALSSWTPRGLGGAVAGGLGLGAHAVGGMGLAIPALAVQSPRLMGEAGLLAGKAARLGEKAPVNADLANFLYQTGRLPQQ
jgi:hypothetical protein